MERLTFDGNFCDIAQCREMPCPYNNSCTQREVWEKLKAYEDTGLTPEEVPTAVEMAQIYSIIEENKRFRALNVTVDRLRELAEADKVGRVVVLPCKAGDKLYRVFDGNISENEVQNGERDWRWERSPFSGSVSCFCSVGSTGAAYITDAGNSRIVSFCFCV